MENYKGGGILYSLKFWIVLVSSLVVVGLIISLSQNWAYIVTVLLVGLIAKRVKKVIEIVNER